MGRGIVSATDVDGVRMKENGLAVIVVRTRYGFRDVLEVNRVMPKVRARRYLLWAAAGVMAGMAVWMPHGPGRPVDRTPIWVFAGVMAALGFAGPYLAALG